MPFNFAAATISAALRIESPSSTTANVAEPLPHKSTSASPVASRATPGWDASHSRVSASAGSTCSDAAARLLNNGNSAADSIASVDSACCTAASSSNAAYAAFVDTPSSIFTRTTVPRAGSNVRSSTSPFSPSCTQPPWRKNGTSAPNARATSSAASLAASSPHARHSPAITAAAFDEPPPRPASNGICFSIWMEICPCS